MLISSLLLGTALLAGCGSDGGPIQIMDMQPRNAPKQAQTPVTITGLNFRTDIGYTIFFGTHASPQVTIINPETLLVMAPQADEAGTVDVMIRADDGQAFRLPASFEYQDIQGGVIEHLGEGSGSEGGSLAY